MNGYTLTLKLKRIRREIYLSSIDQALFHELVSICNENKWPDEFHVKNDILCTSLNISEKTLIKSRNTLVSYGLIYSASLKDKRYGCKYSFKKEVSPVTSAVNIPDEIKKTAGNITGENIISTVIIPVDNPVKSPVIFPAEKAGTPVTIPDDNLVSPVTSAGNIPDETQFTPYKDIKTINRESHARTRETPPKKKETKSRKNERNNMPLNFPFTSDDFMSVWEILRNSPKWKKKTNYALQLSLDKLAKYPEEFAIVQMNRAIESGWTGVVFSPGTDRAYEEWKKSKEISNGKSNNYSNQRNGSSTADARKESVRNLANLAEGVLRGLASQKRE